MAEEFKKQFICLIENAEKYITFTVLTEKEVTRIDKNEGHILHISYKNISCILQIIYSARFMASSLSNLVNNLYERIHGIKRKFGQDDKTCEIKYKYCNYFLETQILKIIS